MRRLLALTRSDSRILTRPFRSPVPSIHLHTTQLKTSLPAPSTERSSEDAPVVTLDFREEPIGLPPSKGFGFLDVNIGDELGPDGSYVVLRKLGYGVYSNVWLARDKRPGQRFVAIKILTTNATNGLRAGRMDEHAFLQRISEPAEYFEEGREHCLTLVDFFDIDREDDSGSHHCLVTEILGKSLVHVRREYPKRIVPLPLLKTVLRHILHALNYLHVEFDIIHTDIKADNIMAFAPRDDEISEYLNANPPHYYPTMNILGHEVRPIASQPITSFASHPSFKLADFGHAQWKVTDDISPTALRPPETILHHYWDEKVDIWAIGCLTFESLTGALLFDPQGDPQGRFSAEDEHLLRMMQLMGQRFPAEMLCQARKGYAFFNPDGSLSRFRGEIIQRSILDSVQAYRTVDDIAELRAAAAFMERCLQLSPRDRASADDLLQDLWLKI